MKSGQLIAIVGGILLMFAPDLWGYRGTIAGDAHHTIGPLLVTFGVVALWVATRDVRWVNPGLAAALLAGPLLITHTPAAVVVAAGVGGAVLISAPFGGPDRQRRGAGWRGLTEGGRRVAEH